MARKSRKLPMDVHTPVITQDTIYDTAIYCRLSTLDSGQKDSESILIQQMLLESYIAEHPELRLMRVFIDNGWSGADFLRPSWNDLINECRSGTIHCIVVKDLSRIGRNYIETGEHLETILPLLNVRVIAVNDNYDSLNLTSLERVMSSLKNLVNAQYVQDISRKTCAAKQIRQKQGAFIGSYASYGYLKDLADKNKIIIDPETAPIVRQIFEWKAEGMGNTLICRRLHHSDIPSPNKYRFLKGIISHEKYANSEWSPTVIAHMLTNEVYLGHMVQGRERSTLLDGGGQKKMDRSDWIIVYHTHEPIISQVLFDQANAVIAERTVKYHERHHKNAAYERPKSLLKGLVFCSDCGKALFRDKNVLASSKKVSYTYQCRTHSILQNCPKKYIHEKDLYHAVFEAIRIEIMKCADVKQIIEQLNRESGHKARLTRFDAEIEEATFELRRTTSLKQAIYDDYAAKLLTVSEYQFATEKYRLTIEKQHLRLESAFKEKEEYTQNSTHANKWITAFSRFMDSKELTAEMAQAMISRVDISNHDNVTVTFKYRDEYMAIQQHMEQHGHAFAMSTPEVWEDA